MEEAKIFTEITTSAVDLHHLHKIFLLYKFGMAGREIGALKEADFRKDPSPPGAPNTLGQRNRRAYEIASAVVSDNGSRLFDRISMFPGPEGRGRKGDVVDADVLVYHLEPWLREGPFDDPAMADRMLTTAAGSARVKDFFAAALLTWPAGVGTPSGATTQFWNDGRNWNGWLQSRGIFEVFLSVLEVTARRILSHGDVPSQASFALELGYLDVIDWNDSGWNRLASPDKNKYLLRRVLEHLFQHAPYPTAGARVASRVNTWMHEPPDTPSFTLVPPVTSPIATASDAAPLTFAWDSSSPFAPGRVPKPVNAYDTASVVIQQAQGGAGGVKTEILAQIETIKTTFSLRSPPDKLDSASGAAPVHVIVTYENLNGSTSATHIHPAV